jgi:hypothetical protein
VARASSTCFQVDTHFVDCGLCVMPGWALLRRSTGLPSQPYAVHRAKRGHHTKNNIVSEILFRNIFRVNGTFRVISVPFKKSLGRGLDSKSVRETSC